MNNEEHLLLIAFLTKNFVRKPITEYTQIAPSFSILNDKSLVHVNLFDQSIWYLIFTISIRYIELIYQTNVNNLLRI